MKTLIALAGAGLLAACATAPSPTHSMDAASQAVVESLYSAFGAGDMDTVTRVLADDVTWLEAPNGPYAAPTAYRGRDAVFANVFGAIAADFDDFAATPSRFHADDGTVVAEGIYTGRGKATGLPLAAPFAHVFEVEGGRIVAFRQYTDTVGWRKSHGS